MRLYSILCLLSCLVFALAWTKEDHEIFDLVSALEAAEGKGVNFYSHLGVEPSASLGDIAKAYRKRSLELHPDKNPGVKGIEDRFARLGVINQILRSPEGRERYNFFYKNGVPKWRGTGYYYSRYRPTLSHTLLFLVLLTAGAHRLVMQLNYNRDIQRIRYFERAARISAGSKSPATGEKDQAAGAKAARRRKVKVPMVEGRDNTGYLDLIVVGDDVFLPNEDGTESPLSSLTTPPSFFRTWPFTLSLSLARRAASVLPLSAQASLPKQLRPASVDDGPDTYAESDSDGEVANGPDTPTPAGKPDRNKASRAMALQRSQGRANGGKKGSANVGADSQATTEVEDTEDDAAVGAGEEKKRRSAGGKANAARRRKMGLKK